MDYLWLDFTLASIHHLLVFGVFVILTMELVHVRPGMTAAQVNRVAAIDGAYGGVSTLILVVGFSRAIWAAKGWEFYEANPFFWTKIALFLIVGLFSIPPTIAYQRWRVRVKADPADLPSAAEINAQRKWLHMGAGTLFLIPVSAAALARFSP